MRLRRRAVGLIVLIAIAGIGIGPRIWRSPTDPVGRVLSVGIYPTTIAVDGEAGRAFVVNEADNSVSLIDTITGAVVATVAVPLGPHALTVDARHGRVIVISTGEQAQIDGPYISYWRASQPGQVSALNATTGGRIWTTVVGGTPSDVALDQQSGRVIALALSAVRTGSTTRGGFGAEDADVLDGASGRIVRTVAIDTFGLGGVSPFGRIGHTIISVNGLPLDSLGLLPLAPLPLVSAALDTPAHRVVLLDKNNSGLRLLDSRNDAIISDTASIGTHPVALAIDKIVGHALVVNGGIPGHVGVFDVANGRLIGTITVGSDPRSIAVDERTGRAFVTNKMSKTVSILDTRSSRLVRTIQTSYPPIAVAVDERTDHAFVVSTTGGHIDGREQWGWIPPWLRSHLPFIPRPISTARASRGSVTVIDASR